MHDALPSAIQKTLQPLFDALPLKQAMPRLVESSNKPTNEHASLVAKLVREATIANNPALVAGLWLYVDQLDASHTVSQSLDNPTGSYWHGIMHRREGDFSNSHYWFRRAGQHPAMPQVAADYDPYTFVNAVEQIYTAPADQQAPLLALQRKEWITLFAWCCDNG